MGPELQDNQPHVISEGARGESLHTKPPAESLSPASHYSFVTFVAFLAFVASVAFVAPDWPFRCPTAVTGVNVTVHKTSEAKRNRPQCRKGGLHLQTAHYDIIDEAEAELQKWARTAGFAVRRTRSKAKRPNFGPTKVDFVCYNAQAYERHFTLARRPNDRSLCISEAA
ncbi:hypothetical protein QC763_0025450 [Podospora pseudopauciseta]|uniref:Uncharacterized protein n=1 Tax=Podospora pseudopauciseta TaxID=2093780 RepID=A0ABR0I2U0_9PEZI|nr:hypothetical protein QC763_0025450 [Podospora pseudopauciseta]